MITLSHYNYSSSEETTEISKFAVIIDHHKKSLVIQKYTKMYQLINSLLRLNMRFTIHRIFNYKPTDEQLTRIKMDLF